MGLYINPTDRTKEQWLAANATDISEQAARNFDFTSPDTHLPICWVKNPGFTAAAIAQDAAERDRFLRSFDSGGDPRPHRWFLAPKTKLQEFMS